MKKLFLLFALVLTVCSTAMADVLTKDSPVGTIGTLDGREAMVVDLGGNIGKVAIATMNVGATNVNDYGTPFSAEDALDSDKNGLTDGWYVPSDLELTLLYPKLDFNKARTGLEWMVTGNSKLTFPGKYYSDGGGRYTGSYVSSSVIEEDEMKKVYAFYFQLDNAITYKNNGYTPSQEDISAIRPFHKLPNSVSYVYPVYNDPNDVTKGIEKWETGKANAIEVTSSTEPVTLGERWTTTWYVVTGKDVTLSQGAICYGNVNLILADDAKLTATGADDKAGITTAADLGNSLTIYGQTAQSGQLIATGEEYSAGIGGGNKGGGADITINGGTVTANGGFYAAGIGGGRKGHGESITINGGTVTANGGNAGAGIGGGIDGFGNNITINGGTVTATGETGAAGIGGGLHSWGNDITVNGGTVTATGGSCAAGIGGGGEGNGSFITINGGTVTANGGYDVAGIGVGYNAIGSSFGIFVANILTLKANDDVIENNGEDLALSLAGKQYVTVSDAICNITANQDPNNKANYYSTFYSGTKAYSVPSGVTAYTGAVDGSVLKLTAIENGIIPAGEAVILRLTTENNTATKQQITLSLTSETVTKSNTNVLTGTNAKMTLGANEYALSLGQYGVGFYLWEGKEIDAHKAYLELPASSAKAFTFQFEDETDGIHSINVNDSSTDSETGDNMYNLNGMRVGKDYKGIVIVNGKKVIK